MRVRWKDDQCRVSENGEQLCLDFATWTPLSKRLQLTELVQRVRSNQDQRQVIICLTDEGRQWRQQGAGIMDEMFCAMGGSREELPAARERYNDVRN